MISSYVIVLQKAVRGWLKRHYFKRLKRSAIVCQKNTRAKQQRKRYLIMKRGFSRLVVLVRAKGIRNKYLAARRRMVLFQARCRGFLVRKFARDQLRLVNHLQMRVRKLLSQKGDSNKRQQEIEHIMNPEKLREIEATELKQLMEFGSEEDAAMARYLIIVRVSDNHGWRCCCC